MAKSANASSAPLVQSTASAQAAQTDAIPDVPAVRPRSRAQSRRDDFMERGGTLALSLVLALIVWLTSIAQENPLLVDQFADAVPLEVRGLDNSLQPVQDLTGRSVEVTIKAPRRTWNTLNSADFIAYVDLTGVPQGEPTVVDVQVSVVDNNVEVVGRQPAQLNVLLDATASKEVPVEIDISGSTAFGYDWQSPIIEPISVTVSGPQTLVDQIVEARGDMPLRNAKQQVESQVELTPYDAQGRADERVQTVPRSVLAVVPVEQWPDRKEVAVFVNRLGEPAEGYRFSNISISPTTVVLVGDSDLLSNVPGFVETEPLDLSGATSEVQRRLNLVLPEGITIQGGSTSVLVTASISPIESGITVTREPTLQGLGAGLRADVPLDSVDVILSGPVPLLDALEVNDVRVVLDLTGLLPGNHTVRPDVIVTEGLQKEGILPQTVEVTITDADSPIGAEENGSLDSSNPSETDPEAEATPSG